MLKIKGWSSFQSYKDRKPPWIRLHKTLLDDYEFHQMSPNARALLPMLWLLASEDKDPVSGALRDSYEKMSFRLRMDLKTFTKTVNEILSVTDETGEPKFLELAQDTENKGCNDDVTEPYSDRYESVPSETETETETETERGGADAPASKVIKIPAKGTRLSPDWELPLEWGKWAMEEEGLTRQQVLDEEKTFRDHWLAQPGSKGVKLDWYATWRNWVRRSKEFKRG